MEEQQSSISEELVVREMGEVIADAIGGNVAFTFKEIPAPKVEQLSWINQSEVDDRLEVGPAVLLGGIPCVLICLRVPDGYSCRVFTIDYGFSLFPNEEDSYFDPEKPDLQMKLYHIMAEEMHSITGTQIIEWFKGKCNSLNLPLPPYAVDRTELKEDQ